MFPQGVPMAVTMSYGAINLYQRYTAVSKKLPIMPRPYSDMWQYGSWAFIEIYWVFPRLPFGIVAYAFTLCLNNLCRNSCIPEAYVLVCTFSIRPLGFSISTKSQTFEN